MVAEAYIAAPVAVSDRELLAIADATDDCFSDTST